MRIILGRASLTLTMLLFAARTKRTMTLTWNTFLKLLNARTSVITLESVFSQPSVSLSSDTSLRRVLYGRILIVYDPWVHSAFHTTLGPWVGVSDYSPIIPNGSQGSQIGSSRFPLASHYLCLHQLLKPLKVSKDNRACCCHHYRRDHSLWGRDRCIRSSTSSHYQSEWKTCFLLLTNHLRQWAEACIHREGSLGHNRSGETLETLPYWETLHPENWPEIRVVCARFTL